MALSDRIAKIKPFFVNFNVDSAEGASVLLVKLPQGWQVPNTVERDFGVQTAARQEGTYFVIELDKGTDVLFDAVDFVIEFNHSIIEKSELLKEKINELKEIFIKNPMEKLKTLEFIFPPQKKGNKKNTKQTTEPTEIKIEAPSEETVEKNVNNEPKIVDIAPGDSEDATDNDLMAMAKGIIGG
jgi:hypothetical protein